MTIRKNKEEIAQLAAQNKELRSTIAKLRKVYISMILNKDIINIYLYIYLKN